MTVLLTTLSASIIALSLGVLVGARIVERATCPQCHEMAGRVIDAERHAYQMSETATTWISAAERYRHDVARLAATNKGLRDENVALLEGRLRT